MCGVCLSGTALGGFTTVDFSTDDNGGALGNGQIIDNNDEFFSDFTLSHSGPSEGIVIFDSTAGVNAADPDMWVNSGNILTNQMAGSSSTGDFYDTPDDDANGGSITFNFNTAVELCTIDLVDINGNNQNVTITMFDTSGNSRVFFVPDEWTGDLTQDPVPGIMTLDFQNVNPQAGFGSVAVILTDDGIDMNDVISVQFDFAGSGGLDNLTYTVPAPSALALLVGAGLARRRRRA